MSVALDFLLLATGWTHVFLAPYTKVEESFNLHATHDVLMYGVKPAALHNFDHFVFPGAVPRTFTGSVALAWLSIPVIQLASLCGLVSTKFDLQLIVRLMLATINGLTLCLIRRAVARRFGRPTSFFFTLLTCSQFHIPFWMGRTLPNMFALFPVNISTYLLVDRAPNATRPSRSSINGAIALLIFTSVVFRAEVVLLLAPLALQSLFSGHVSFKSLLKLGTSVGLASVALTVVVDSYFWKTYPMWPELSGIYFNVFEGKSSAWGVSPFHAYFTSHLPKLLLWSLPLSALGLLLDPRIKSLLLPPTVFIGLISFLGHKEWRFIVYVVPLFNVAAARGARWKASRKKSSLYGRIMFLLVSGLVLSNFLVTLLITRASIANYPGGDALALLNGEYADVKHVHVHISNLAAQTGASLFLQTHSRPFLNAHKSVSHPTNWVYNKTESLPLKTLTADKSITHLISETQLPLRSGWELLHSVPGFERWRVDWDLLKGNVGKGEAGLLARVWGVLTIVETEKLWIYKRR